MKIKVLLIGESWMVHVAETKGADIFTYDYYEVGTKYIKEALSTDDIEFFHMPCHLVEYDFPASAKELREQYDAVLISDVGANTFLLPAKTFLRYEPLPNKLEILRDFVKLGGGLCMVGGYLSFMGMEGKGRYDSTPIEEALPVDFLPHDDRMELPQGVSFKVDTGIHDIFEGLTSDMPMVFGYNRARLKPGASAVLEYKGDPIISLMEYESGRSMGYAMDCGPHWCSVEFCESAYYKKLWRNIVKWLAKK